MPEPARYSRTSVVCLVGTVVCSAVIVYMEFLRLDVPVLPGIVYFLLMLALFSGMIGIGEIDRSQGRLRGRKLIELAYVLTVLLFCVLLYLPVYFYIQHSAERAKEVRREREVPRTLPANSGIE